MLNIKLLVVKEIIGRGIVISEIVDSKHRFLIDEVI